MDDDRRDEQHVDEVTSALERIRSRRSVLKAGLGAALAGIGLARPARAAADGRTGVDEIEGPECAPSIFTVSVEVSNPTNGAMITLGLFAKRRGGDKFLDTTQRVTITLVADQEAYQASFDASAFQARLQNGRTEYTALRVQAVGAAGGTFNRSVMRTKSDGIPPCGETPTTSPPTTTAPPTTTSPPQTTTTGPPTTTAQPGTTSPPTTTSPPGTTPPPTTASPTTTGP